MSVLFSKKPLFGFLLFAVLLTVGFESRAIAQKVRLALMRARASNASTNDGSVPRDMLLSALVADADDLDGMRVMCRNAIRQRHIPPQPCQSRLTE